MSLRTRLIVAFFLFSVVPLAAVTFYSYTSNERALQAAARHETEMLTGELTQRMQVVTVQIGERVEHLMDMPVTTATVAGTSGQTTPPKKAATTVARATAAKTPARPVAAAAPPSAPAAPPAGAAPATIDAATIEGQVAASLGEVAMLLNNVELRGMGRYGGRFGGLPRQPSTAAPGAAQPATGAPETAPRAAGIPRVPVPPIAPPSPSGRGRGDVGTAQVPAAPGVPPEAQGREGEGRRGRRGFRSDLPRLEGEPVTPSAVRGPVPPTAAERGTSPPSVGERGALPPASGERGAPPLAGGTSPMAVPDASDPTRMTLDLTPIRRDLFREMAPNGSFEQMTPEERARIGREVNQRLLGIVQGIQLGAAELQKKAEAAQRQAAAVSATSPAAPNTSAPPAAAPGPPGGDVEPPTRPAAAPGARAPSVVRVAPRTPPAPAAQAAAPAPPTQPAKPMTRKAALTGTRLNVRMESDGQVVRQVNAEINLPNLLATVFANTRRDSGEIPFAVGKDGHLYAPTEADRAKLATLDVARVDDTPGTKRVGNWIVVTMPDRSGAGLRFGIARPVGNVLNDLRRTTARNAGFGLLFITIALAGMVPLSGRLTRNLTYLTDGVGRIAQGDYGARVPVKSRDEIGRLAAAFNQMAADVEQHQRSAIEQERIRRELELGRRIQSDMLPRAPLHFGLTEVKGVSVPAREVGGDFFNYFQLDSGRVALLVGDVSGKGVGAALLMANIQASLRTRFALGQELSAIAEAIDHDIEANSPGPVYATLFIAIFDPATRRMRYVNAGHNPQFVLRGDGRLEKMSSTGLPVGMLAGHGYVEIEVQLAPGDLLFFYTDGCVEMENETGEMFGSDRLESLVAASGGGSADHVLVTVERAISTFRGGRDLFDDATMMAVTIG